MAGRKRILSGNRAYIDYMLMLAVLAVVGWYYYGENALRTLITGVLSAVLIEVVALRVMKRDVRGALDCHAAFTGAAIAMMLPATANISLVIAGAAFAILVVKIPFGSALKTPFVPAAAAMAFLTVCFPSQVYAFPQIASVSQETSLAALLNSGGAQHLNLLNAFQILTGSVPGPMGAGCAVVLVGCCAYLAIRRPQALCNIFGFVAAAAVLALIFPRGAFGRGTSLLTELCAGTLLFSAVFFSTDPATSPRRIFPRFVYGALMGALCMALRYVGAFEDPSCFAVLLANAAWPAVESVMRRLGLEKLSVFKKSEKQKKDKTVEKASEGGEA